VSEAFEIVASS